MERGERGSEGRGVRDTGREELYAEGAGDQS